MKVSPSLPVILATPPSQRLPGFDGIREGSDDFLTDCEAGVILPVFSVCFARDGHLTAVKHTAIDHEF